MDRARGTRRFHCACGPPWLGVPTSALGILGVHAGLPIARSVDVLVGDPPPLLCQGCGIRQWIRGSTSYLPQPHPNSGLFPAVEGHQCARARVLCGVARARVFGASQLLPHRRTGPPRGGIKVGSPRGSSSPLKRQAAVAYSAGQKRISFSLKPPGHN